MSVKTPNYCLVEPHTYYANGYGGDHRDLPAGSWVRPIQIQYVPKHVTEDKRWSNFDPKSEIFVYCRFGIIAVPLNIVKER